MRHTIISSPTLIGAGWRFFFPFLWRVQEKLLSLQAMSRRREKQKPQKAMLNKQLEASGKPVRNEKLILEGGKFCLDIAKLVFGGVILAGIMSQDVNVALLLVIGFSVVLIFSAYGFYLINKLK